MGRLDLNCGKMMTLPDVIADYSMTLVIAARNQSTIVVGYDSLRGSRQDGKNYTDAKKRYKITDDCVVLLAGSLFNMGQVDQFLLDFTDTVEWKKLSEVTDIARELHARARSTIVGNLDANSNIVFLVVGFNKDRPLLFSLNSNTDFSIIPASESYISAGRSNFANEMCESFELKEDMDSDEIESTVYQILLATSAEFPDEVGGTLSVEVLSSV